MGWREYGKVVREAEAQGVTPQDYLRALVAKHGSIRKAAKAENIGPDTFYYHFGKEQEMIVTGRIPAPIPDPASGV